MKLQLDLVTEEEDYAENILLKLKKKYETPRLGLHLSDIVGCPRQSAFKAIKGWTVNERTAYNFGDGEAIHKFFEDIIQLDEDPNRYEIEKTQWINKFLEFTPDIFDKWTETVIDIKTSRTDKPQYRPYEENIEQITAYMAFKDAKSGVLLYHILTAEQELLTVQWRIRVVVKKELTDYVNRIIYVTPENLKGAKIYWLDEAKDLKYAIDQKNPYLAKPRPAMEVLNADENDPFQRKTIARPTYAWHCDKRYCQFIDYCTEGYRAREKIIRIRTEDKEAKLLSKKNSKAIQTQTQTYK